MEENSFDDLEMSRKTEREMKQGKAGQRGCYNVIADEAEQMGYGAR